MAPGGWPRPTSTASRSSASASSASDLKLMCMTRLSDLDLSKPVTVEPMRAFPPLRDLVTDVSWNFRVKKQIKRFTPRPPDAGDGTWRMAQADVDRVQEFRKCIECFRSEADVHDTPQRPGPIEAGHGRTDAGVSTAARPCDRRLVELPRQEADQALHPAAAGRRRWHLADGPGRRRPRPGVPQVHRVLPI